MTIGKKLLKSCFLWGIAIVGYYIWFQAFYNSVRFQEVFHYTDLYDMLIGMCYNFPPIIIVFLFNILIVFSLAKVGNLKLKICIDLATSIIMACSVNWLYIFMLQNLKVINIDWAGTILNDILIFMVVEIVYYFTCISKVRKEVEEARVQALQYQYDALKSQINPHFLFNSLNLLYSLVSIDTIRSRQFIRELSKMYRYIMSKHNCERVSMKEELDFLESYIYVLEMRYNKKFTVILNGQENLKHLLERELIPFTLQLLIENVTKHNAITTQQPMTVTIDITDSEITISNPIYPREKESISHIGLRYLTQLYANNGKTFGVEKTDNIFIAHVPLL